MLRFLCLFLLVLTALPARAQLIISEFMASNSTGITDTDGDHSDWIEIYNPSSSAVSLSGWYLTDKSTNLTEWPFPAQSLAAGGRLIVFASGKNRITPDLATGFKLSASGEYLALTQAAAGGGVTIATQFSPAYPPQFANISYGLSANTATALITPGTTPLKVLIPTVANGGSMLGSSWTGSAATEPFADGSWQSGFPGVGVAGSATAIGNANLKLRLNATSASALVTDTSGAAHSGINTASSTVWVSAATDTAATPRLRHGLMQFTAVSGSQVTVPSSTDFNSTMGTICFWMQSSGLAGSGNEGAMLWDRRTGTGDVLVLHADGTIFSQPVSGGTSFSSTATVNDNLWHFIAFTYNSAANGTDSIYVDGVLSGSTPHGSAWSWPPSQEIELGNSHDSYWYKYNGLLDDVRFYNTPLTATQIGQIYTGADENVDPSDVNTSIAAALGTNSSAFLRIPFTVADLTAYQDLGLTVRSKDGFIAYLNGQPLASVNTPASPAWNSAAPTWRSPA